MEAELSHTILQHIVRPRPPYTQTLSNPFTHRFAHSRPATATIDCRRTPHCALQGALADAARKIRQTLAEADGNTVSGDASPAADARGHAGGSPGGAHALPLHSVSSRATSTYALGEWNGEVQEVQLL